MSVGRSRLAVAARREAFVEAYLQNGNNATAAAKSAGYSRHTARRIGQDLLKHPEVSSVLEQRRREIAEKNELRTENVVSRLRQIIDADPRSIVVDGKALPLDQWPADIAAAVSAVEITPDGTVRLRLHDKTQGADKLLRVLGSYGKDNAQLSAAQQQALETLSGPRRGQTIAYAIALVLDEIRREPPEEPLAPTVPPKALPAPPPVRVYRELQRAQPDPRFGVAEVAASVGTLEAEPAPQPDDFEAHLPRRFRFRPSNAEMGIGPGPMPKLISRRPR